MDPEEPERLLKPKWYGGWLQNPAPVGLWFIPFNPIIFRMFHSYLTVANWCRISQPSTVCPSIFGTWIISDPSHGKHLSKLSIESGSFFIIDRFHRGSYMHRQMDRDGDGHSFSYIFIGIDNAQWQCLGWWWSPPGFGELEEYFLPREIGEITGQAKVPFGDLSESGNISEKLRNYEWFMMVNHG